MRPSTSRPGHDAATPSAAFVLAALFATQVAGDAIARRSGGLVPHRLVVDAAALDPTIGRVPGEGLDLTTAGLRIRVRPLSAADRASHFALRTRDGVNVLPTSEAGDPFTVFSLSVENQTGRIFTFLASSAQLKDQNDATVSPLPIDVLQAMFLAAFANSPDPEGSTREALRVVHGGPLVLEHGQHATRLLVFPPPPRGAKRVTLSLEHLEAGEKTLTPTFPFLLAPVGGESR